MLNALKENWEGNIFSQTEAILRASETAVSKNIVACWDCKLVVRIADLNRLLFIDDFLYVLVDHNLLGLAAGDVKVDHLWFLVNGDDLSLLGDVKEDSFRFFHLGNVDSLDQVIEMNHLRLHLLLLSQDILSVFKNDLLRLSRGDIKSDHLRFSLLNDLVVHLKTIKVNDLGTCSLDNLFLYDYWVEYDSLRLFNTDDLLDDGGLVTSYKSLLGHNSWLDKHNFGL